MREFIKSGNHLHAFWWATSDVCARAFRSHVQFLGTILRKAHDQRWSLNGTAMSVKRSSGEDHSGSSSEESQILEVKRDIEHSHPTSRKRWRRRVVWMFDRKTWL